MKKIIFLSFLIMNVHSNDVEHRDKRHKSSHEQTIYNVTIIDAHHKKTYLDTAHPFMNYCGTLRTAILTSNSTITLKRLDPKALFRIFQFSQHNDFISTKNQLKQRLIELDDYRALNDDSFTEGDHQKIQEKEQRYTHNYIFDLIDLINGTTILDVPHLQDQCVKLLKDDVIISFESLNIHSLQEAVHQLIDNNIKTDMLTTIEEQMKCNCYSTTEAE